MTDVIIEKSGSLSRRYYFDKNHFFIECNGENNSVYLHGSGTVSIIQNEEPVYMSEFTDEVVTLNTNETDYFRLKAFLDAII